MKIESVEVIPMRKDSLFEATPLQGFECSFITTSYDEWRPAVIDEYLKRTAENQSKISQPQEFDDVCEKFAKSQKAFMLAPTAIFHDRVYVAKTAKLPTPDHLFAMGNVGPVYMVIKVFVDDMEAGKTVERFYVDPASFAPMYGMWYPQKAMYMLRYGTTQ